MKNIAVTIVMLLLSVAAWAEKEVLSERSSVSMITCEPGDAIYSAFGHSAIRIVDPEMDMDMYFHWGVFSFETPHFVWRFVKGETDYEMGIVPGKYFKREYQKRNSAVHEQVLDLTQEQKQAIYEAVWENYLPENRMYRYNFVYDNCATRPYHMIMGACGESVGGEHEEGTSTFRDIIWQHVKSGTFWSLAIDIVIGSEADRPIGTEEMVAFPLYTMRALGSYSVRQADGGERPFAASTRIIGKGRELSLEDDPFTLEKGVNAAIPIALLIVLMITARRSATVYKTVSTAILTAAALSGCVVFFLMFISEHPLVHANYNLMWLNPLYVISIMLTFVRPSRTGKVMSMALLALTAAFAIVLIAGVQRMCLPLMLWWLTTVYISLNIYRKQKQGR